MNVINYVMGYSRYECPLDASARVLNGLIGAKIEFFDQCENGGIVSFCIFRKSERCAAMYLGECRKVSSAGLYQCVSRIKKRSGLALGALLCIACVYASGLFLWDITYPNEELEALLTDAGLRTGAFIPDINEDIIEIKALMNTDEYSYISININGTTASVDYEKRHSAAQKENAMPSNLVASADGVIVRYEVYSGDAVCNVGQTVQAGELLISGFDETKHHGARVVRARGAVYAVTDKEFSVTQPTYIEEKVYTGEQSVCTKYSVCGLSFTVGKSEDGGLWENETEKRRITLFGVIDLPIYAEKTVKRQYELNGRELTAEQAERYAKILYREQLGTETKGCEVLSRTVQTKTLPDAVTVTCRLQVICDITKEIPISVIPNADG